MMERTSDRRIIILPITNRNKNTCNMFLRRFVHGNSKIYSDGRKEYNDLKTHFKDPITGVHTTTIEGSWNGLKRQIPIKCRNQSVVHSQLSRIRACGKLKLLVRISNKLF
jgi:hypothetical protein